MSTVSGVHPGDSPHPKGSGAPYRVVIVEESAVVRGMLSRWLGEVGLFDVVARFDNQTSVSSKVETLDVEVVVLDIDAEKMDGMQSLKDMRARLPGAVIGVLSRRAGEADCTLDALKPYGADFLLQRPMTKRDVTNSRAFRSDLTELVQEMGELRRSRTREPFARIDAAQSNDKPAAESEARSPRKDAEERTRSELETLERQSARRKMREVARPLVAKATGSGAAKTPPIVDTGTYQLSQASTHRPQILAIGSSTGGPKALYSLFEALRGKINVPVVVTQHMPPMFTAVLADHLSKASGLTAKEAEDGEVVRAGTIYVAPGDYHMELVGSSTGPTIHLHQGPEENFCRPSVNPMLRSVTALYGPKVLCVILTGMGQDGCEGAKGVVETGGTVLAQDQASSVVWGMPGAVAKSGLAAEILPLAQIGPSVERYLKGARK